MTAVVAGGLRPSAGSGRMKAAFAEAPPVVSTGHSLAIKKAAPTSCFIKRWGRWSVVLREAGYDAWPSFTSCLLYLPRYSAACMAIMRPELLAQEACEPGARETS